MVKISQKRFTGKDKTVDTFPSVDLISRTIELSARLTDQDINQTTDGDEHEQMVKMVKLIRDMKAYVQDVAKLSNKELSKYIEHADMATMGNDIGYLAMRMQGMSNHDINLATKKQEEISKKADESD